MNTRRLSIKQFLVAAALLILTTGLAGSTIAVKADPTLQHVSNELKMEFTVLEPVPDPVPVPVDTGSSEPTTEQITVVVDSGDSRGGTVSTATIERTTKTNGSKQDKVTFTPDKAQETLDRAVVSGQKTSRIVIPDTKDEVAEVNVSIPRDTLSKLSGGSMSLEIYTDNARIVLPSNSLNGLDKDVFFRVVPIKDQPQRLQVEQRAKQEQVVRDALGDGTVQVVGRPATIETNISSRPVDIVLPLRDVTLPTDAQERQSFLADLVIFIEHSDGDRVLVKPEPIAFKDEQLGLKFTVTKFSTFTILNMENWEEYFNAQQGAREGKHQPYMLGYPDQTFRPDRGISRAEMAAILNRLGARSAAGASNVELVPAAYTDLEPQHWAHTAIDETTKNGLMSGYPDGSFAPEKPVTRAELAAVVSRWKGYSTEGDVSSKLTDLAGHWALRHIAQAEQDGLVQGFPDGTFQPDKPLSRAEAVTTLNRLLKRGPLTGYTLIPWSDVSRGHWAADDIMEASVPHSFTKDASGKEKMVEPQ
ncbi:S-layer homology domain-containing protein [Paenibacillus sp. YYML68]|uniref:S-layer homology domain-containing protein n=1 Tax=Paenibacillus sp. YYML68 TaxID=2909250 RepID=UPI0024914256|nr:S-layer homology domain-containing protein [Paenibacillus sp. YYML68]